MVIVVVPLSARFVGANERETETVGATAFTVKEAEAAVPVTVGDRPTDTGASVVWVIVPGTPV
jgi:hypothetical protein